ncbi:MAG TPA: hypothetical protein VLT88_13900, partial [Desulfosarcina sp.]|nr:hypothetical protein [Desulfosarcina sp.]
CADLYAALDRRTAASTIDAAYQRISGFPYLRIDRFLASFRGEADDQREFGVWIGRLQDLDRSARRIEIDNLTDVDLAGMGWEDRRDALFDRVVACADLLKTADFADASNHERLHRNATAEDEYIALRRTAGLYPLTQVFVAWGVRRWHAQEHKTFSTRPPENGRTVRYAPDAASDVAAASRIIRTAERDALGIPVYSAQDRGTLFAAHAPFWEVQTRDDDDRIGAPTWQHDGAIGIDTDRPETYTHLSFTRSGKTVLTQLNFIVWFPARPKTDSLDIYGGRLDGLNYRVTVDADGNPLLYETMHNCGCYYKAYPPESLRVRESIPYAEPPLVLEAPPIDPAWQTMVVSMESRTHYVRHLYPLPRGSAKDVVDYALHDYDRLRRLPLTSGGRRSMFDRYGLVPGIERLERHILWPTGVLSPGGMRQWGKHAVAFVGKRHFDDPFYLDKMFKVAGGLPE